MVLEDADMELAISKALSGRLGNSGQACINSKRFIIHSSLYEEFVEKLLKKLDDYVVGDPLDEKT